ncbi:MAG: alkaline phosphatase family protein [Hyphomicrobiaceae bacterium]|nr:alkaline phosphatase family protein [Hyphomicrobiaceae bacterium]
MINDHTLTRFKPLGEHLLKPIYADYSFANIPATAHYLLTGEETGSLLPPDCFGGCYPAPEKVVLVFVDSFGWQFWQRWWRQSRIMRQVVEHGVLTPISALFPSTTSASVTTINMGTLPARHGVYEWNMYVPAFGEVIQSLPFALLGQGPGSAATKGYTIEGLLEPQETAHQRLARHGVASIQIAARAYAGSPYNRLASAGAEIVPYGTLAEALVALETVVNDRPGKAFVNFYWAGLDAAAHIHGPGSPVHDAEVIAFWAALDQLIGRRSRSQTLWLFTADHGHIAVRAKDTINVNERWPELRSWLARSPRGDTIWPCGSPRDMFLHVEAERRQDALDLLSKGLDGVARVLTMDEALAEELLGPTPVAPELRRRLGDILVLPYREHFVWWKEPGLVENRFNGHHGGLAADELISVLGVVPDL